ncbi:hypothetical protein, partial [Deinococcus frigens]
AYVQLETKKADKATSQYGQTFDRLKGKLDITQSLENLGRPAGEITKQLSAIGTSASQAADAEKKRNGETVKYRALLDLAGDAAKRLKTIEGKKPELSPLDREKQTLAETRAQQALEKAVRAANGARLAAIVKGGVQKEGDLDRVKAAEAEIKRRADVEDAAGKKALANEKTRRKEAQQQAAQVNEAIRQNDIDSAEAGSKRLQQMRENDVHGAGDNAAQVLAAEKRYASLGYQAQKAVLDKQRKDREADITNSKLPKSVKADQLKTSGEDYHNELNALDATRKERLEKAEADLLAFTARTAAAVPKALGDSLEAGLRQLRDSEKDDLVAAKGNSDFVQQQNKDLVSGLEERQKAVRDTREAYSKLADGIRDKISSGRVELADITAYRQALDEQTAATIRLGIAGADYLQSAQATSEALYQQAIDAAVSNGASSNLAEGHTLAAEAAQSYVVSLEDALAQIPGTTTANEAYLKVLIELEAAGRVAAGTVETVSQAMRDQEAILANTAAWMERLTTEAGKASDALVELGDTAGAMQTLQDALDEAWAASRRGEDAAATISDLTDKINALAKSTALSEGFNSFFSMLSGTIEEQISQVVGQLDHITDPAMVARLRALLAELRQGVMPYQDPSKAGYAPNSNGGGFTGQTSNGLTPEVLASARDLTAALNTELDPATLGTAMTGAADLLASEVGQALPAATKKGLEDGITNAKAYQDALASITADAIVDGHNRAANAPALPDNRFKEFSDQIMGGTFDLSDPEVLRGLNEGLDEAVKKGQLTASQLDTLRVLIDSINAHPVDVLPDAERWQQVDEWNDKLGKLEANLESGASTQDEFTTSALEALPALDRLAEAAERQGKTDLAAAWRAAAAGVRQLGGEALEAAEKLLKLQAAATGLESIGNGLASIFNAFGLGDVGKLSSALGGVFKAGLNIQSSYKAIGPAFQKSFGAGLGAVGGFLGAVGEGINLVGQIGDAILNLSPGFQAWKKDLLEVAEIQKKALGAGSGGFKSPWAEQLQQDAAKREKLGNAGFWQRVWWGLTGSAPQVMKTESAKLLAELQTIFAGLGEGISNSLTSSMTDAFLKGDMADFAANFGKSFDQVVGRVVLQTMIDAAIQEGAVATDLGELTQAIKDRRYNDIPGILSRIKQHAGEAMAPIAALAPSLPGYGSGGGSGGSGGSEPTISPVDKRRRDELLYRYENAIDPAEKERLRKELLGLDPSAGGGGGSSTTVTLSPVKTETPDWAALNAGINRLADFGAQSDQIARMESETARMNRESAGVMAQAAGMMLLASQGRGSGTGPGNINF